MDWSNSVFT